MGFLEDCDGKLLKTEEVASIFNLTVRRISQLTADGILSTVETKVNGRKVRRYEFLPTLHAYLDDMQARANGRNHSDSEIELKKKKLEAEIALKESQGELHQLKTSIASGEYISIEEVQMDYSRFFVTFKKFAMNLPARVIGIIAGQLDPTEARKLEQDLSREVNGILEAFVVAGTEDKPAKEKKPKRGRPKKTAN